MSHQNINVFAFDPLYFGVLDANFLPVDVAMYSDERFEGSQSRSSFPVADVACMEKHIAIGKKVVQFWVDKSMCV
jgi:hypothetical protein